MRIAVETNVAGSKSGYWRNKPHHSSSKTTIDLRRPNEWTWSDHKALAVILDCGTQTLNGCCHEQGVASAQWVVDATLTTCDCSQNQPPISE
jgi:hypothetical protein